VFPQSLAIVVVLENVFALVPAIHDVVNRSRILYAQLARHNYGLSPQPNVSIVRTDTLRRMHGNLRN
jgi:hypothetical protein